MGTNSAIQWTDHSWNPWQGCTKTSPACLNCYMYRDKKRYGQNPFRVVRSSDVTFNQPLKKKWKAGDKIFACSWSDFFHLAADEWRPGAWEIIRQRPDLIFQILTKRPELMADRLPADWGSGWNNIWKHVWLGATVENQEWLEKRSRFLLQTPAAVHFLSYEPALGPIDLNGTSMGQLLGPCDECGERGSNPECEACAGIPSIAWVIAGGENGPGARPMETEWARSVRDQCQAAGVPFFFKGHGSAYEGMRGYVPGLDIKDELDHSKWNQFPEVRP